MAATRETRLFAIIPAAGLSRRMGEPKLLLPCGTTTIIGQLLETLTIPEISCRVVVCRREDRPLATEVDTHEARLVQPLVDPPDMKTSVLHAIEFLQKNFEPHGSDGWLLIPGDHPLVSPRSLHDLILAWKQDSQTDVMIPTFNERRGHPACFRWSLVNRLSEIPNDSGLNWLRLQPDITFTTLALNDPGLIADLDTPEDYQRWVSSREANEN